MLFFRRKQRKLTEAEQKWNRMWELWVHGNIPSPALELMNYQSEVNNGGHDQYFFNTSNVGKLEAEITVLLQALPEPLGENLLTALNAWTQLEAAGESEAAEAALEECDQAFYTHEAELNAILEDFARTMELN